MNFLYALFFLFFSTTMQCMEIQTGYQTPPPAAPIMTPGAPKQSQRKNSRDSKDLSASAAAAAVPAKLSVSDSKTSGWSMDQGPTLRSLIIGSDTKSGSKSFGSDGSAFTPGNGTRRPRTDSMITRPNNDSDGSDNEDPQTAQPKTARQTSTPIICSVTARAMSISPDITSEDI